MHKYGLYGKITVKLSQNNCIQLSRMISKQELAALKRRLPRGYFKKVLAKVDYSEKTVSNFFSGHSYHLDIHQAAIQVAVEYEKKVEELRKQTAL